MKKNTYTDCNNDVYEVLNYQELQDRAAIHDPLAQKVLKWLHSVSNLGTRTEFYLSQKLVDALDTRLTDQAKPYYYAAFTPPMAGLTLDDFFAWGKQQEVQYRGNGFYQWHWSRQYSKYSWRETVIAQRSAGRVGRQDQRLNWDFQSRLPISYSRAWSYRKTGVPTYRSYDFAQLNWLLHSFLTEATDPTLTLRAYVDGFKTGASPEQQEGLKNLRMDHTAMSSSWVRFVNASHAASIAPGRPRAALELLFDQDLGLWRQLIKDAPAYRKGKTARNLEELIEDVKRSLGRSKTLDYTVYSPQQLQREFTLLIAEAVLFEGPYYNPSRLHGLAAVALDTLQAAHNLETFAQEYSKILHLVRSNLEAEKSAAELQLILAEGDDEEHVREAAKSAGKMTLMQTVGLLFAIHSPRGWIRGTATNGPYLLVEMLEAEGMPVIQFISEVLFENHTAVPTEAEWRKAMGVVPFSAPAGLGLSLMVSSTAARGRSSRSYGDQLLKARALFGARK